MATRSLTIQVPPDDARAYETASPEQQRRVDDALRRRLREITRTLPSAAETATAAPEPSRKRRKISGLLRHLAPSQPVSIEEMNEAIEAEAAESYRRSLGG